MNQTQKLEKTGPTEERADEMGERGLTQPPTTLEKREERESGQNME